VVLDEKVAIDYEFDASRLNESGMRIGVDYDDFGEAGTADYVNQYRYDALGRLTRVTQGESTATGHHAVAEKRVDLTYNKDSQLASITRYAALTATSLVAASTYGYDNRGRLTSLSHKKNSTTFAGYGFSYDDANRLTSLTNSAYANENAAFTYDDRGQLTFEDRGGYPDDRWYDYDQNGNRQAYEIVVGWNNRLERDDFAGYSYLYDAEGNRTLQYDYASYSKYEWDHRNRLVAVVDYDNAGTPYNEADDFVTRRVDYVYDAFNQLIKRTVDGDGNLATPADIDQTFFLYDMGQVALEFHKEGSDNVTAGDLEHRYLWNPAAVDQLLADETVNSLSNAAANDTLWALTDHLGSVRELVDDAGVLQNHKSYDAFGQVMSETNASADTAFGYTGRYLDEATGLQNNLHRWYDASTGRWLSEDPIGFAAGDANLYRYVGNSPTMYVDPTGLVRPPSGPMPPGSGPMLDGKVPGINKIPTDKLKWYLDDIARPKCKEYVDLYEKTGADRYYKDLQNLQKRINNVNRELIKRSFGNAARCVGAGVRYILTRPFVILAPQYLDSDGDGTPDGWDPDTPA
jgi:RHS repeat-associated protein